MTNGGDDLERRREGVRDMRPIVPIRQFDLTQIKRHFEESMEAITSLSAIADEIVAEKPHDAEAIWRAQLVLVESALDFYMHEIGKYGIRMMFGGEWAMKNR